MTKNPLNALKQVFSSKKMLFIAIIFSFAAAASLCATVSGSPDLTKFTIPVIGYELEIGEFVGEDIASFLETLTTVILVINIITVLPQLLCAVALWLIRSGKDGSDSSARRACIGLAFIKFQAFFKGFTGVVYALFVAIVSVLALTAGGTLGNSVFAVLGISVLIIAFFVLVISYYSKLMTMMITVSNTLRTGYNHVSRFALVNVLNWFFAVYHILAGFSGDVFDIIGGICTGLVFLFITFLFADFRDECGYADAAETKAYMKSLSTDSSRRETAEILGFQTIKSPIGEIFAPTVKGILLKQFFGISVSSTRMSEANATLASDADSSGAPSSCELTEEERKKLTEERDAQRRERLLSECKASLEVIELKLLNAEGDMKKPITAALGFSNPPRKLLSKVKGVREALSPLTDSEEAQKLIQSCQALEKRCLDASNKALPKLKKRRGVSILSFATVVAITIAIIIPTVIVPSVRLQRAAKLREDGNLIEAYYILKALDGEKALAERESLKEQIEYFILPDNIKVIDEYEFEGFTAIKEIRLHSKVNSVGFGAFKDCDRLETLQLHNGDISIAQLFGVSGTYETIAPNLKSVTYLGGDSICSEALRGCSALIEVELPEGLKTIDNGAFIDCSSLKALHIPDSVESYAGDFIHRCVALEELTIPQSDGDDFFSLPYIGNENALKSVHVTRATVLSNSAFSGYEKLQEVVLPEGLTEIGRESFKGCTSLKEIRMPTTLEKIGYYAFEATDIERVIVVPEKWAQVELESREGNLGARLFTDSEDGIVPVTELILPEGVTKIGANTFASLTTLKTVKLPSSVKKIGDYAFIECSMLETMSLGDGVEYIGDHSFSGCASLKSLVTPTELKTIGNYAFSECSLLSEVLLNEGLVTVGGDVFSGCTRVQELVLPDSLESIGSLDYMVSLMKITLGKKLNAVPSYSFHHCQRLAEVYDRSENGVGSQIRNYYYNLPLNYYTDASGTSRLVAVGDYVFLDGSDGEAYLLCYRGNSEKITLPSDFNGKEYSVWNYALAYQDKITSVTLSAGVKKLYDCVISFSPLVSELYVEVGNPYYYSVNNCVVDKVDDNYYASVVLGCKNSVIPTDSSVGYIYNYAFYGCLGLKSITVPSNICTTGYSSFAECRALTYAYVAAKSINSSWFENCTSLKEVRFGEALLHISDNVFDGCVELEKITLPDSLTKIDRYAFNGCDKLVKYGDDGCAYVGKWLISVRSSEEITEVSVRAGTVGIVADAFSWTQVSSVTLPEGLKYIGDSAFSNTKIRKLRLPDSVVSIGYNAFSHCAYLEEINIPKGITSFALENLWFLNTPNVTETVDGITYVDTWVVGAEKNITAAQIREGTVGISDRAFYDCRALSSVTLPSTLRYVMSYAFENCSSLTEITLPEGITSLGYRCFSATGITELLLPRNIAEADCVLGNSKDVKRSIYYCGSKENYSAGGAAGYNTNVTLYYYSPIEPNDTLGNYWYYNGSTPTPWFE